MKKILVVIFIGALLVLSSCNTTEPVLETSDKNSEVNNSTNESTPTTNNTEESKTNNSNTDSSSDEEESKSKIKNDGTLDDGIEWGPLED